MSILNNPPTLPITLSDGLIIRRATAADTAQVAALNEQVLRDPDEPALIFDAWTRDLMSGRHPTNTAADFVVVEDTKTGQIVSSTCLIPQVWSYEEIRLKVGRPELVATAPAYRRRGLVKALFEVIHAQSAAKGHLAQGVTGIPWFYRQFGYEYALPLGGWRTLHFNDVPALKTGEGELYQTRPAGEADIPILMSLYQRHYAGKLVITLIDEARWRYDISGHSPGSVQALRVWCVLNQSGQVVGYYTAAALPWQGHLIVWEVVVAPGISLHAVLPTITRALKTHAESYQSAVTEPSPLTGVRFYLGQEHPVYKILEAKLGPWQQAYAWYVRVADLPAFIRHVGPVLERRLASSVMVGYSGELKITFYCGGLRLVFEQGRLIEAAHWQAAGTNEPENGAGFPPLVFLQLLFGYRSLAELHAAFPDCWADEEPTLLLNILFPRRASLVFPLG